MRPIVSLLHVRKQQFISVLETENWLDNITQQRGKKIESNCAVQPICVGH